MKKIIFLALLTVTTNFCFGQALHIVNISGFNFIPDPITINQGDTIEWINLDNTIHTSTSGTPGSPDGVWDSGNLSMGMSFKHAFTSPGVFTYFCIPHSGFMNGYTVNVVQCNPSTGTDTQAACNSYTWIDGNTYTSNNNTATFNIVGGAANGCDSLVTLDLTIVNSTTGTDTRTECNSYTWIDGNTYTSNNNTATFNIVGGAANGCDSLVTLDLTINTVDTGTTTDGITITSNATGASYQWLDCDNSLASISGETGQSFTPSSNGNYAVEVTINACTDTSSCTAITPVGVIENHFGNSLIVYPNPSNGNINIVLGAIYPTIITKVLSANGMAISTKEFNNSGTINFDIEGESGYYFVEITASGNKKAVIKILKQ